MDYAQAPPSFFSHATRDLASPIVSAPRAAQHPTVIPRSPRRGRGPYRAPTLRAMGWRRGIPPTFLPFGLSSENPLLISRPSRTARFALAPNRHSEESATRNPS